ncbi:MAG: hypothetical protein AAFU64_15085, partial [Bacteroidota bacterium]
MINLKNWDFIPFGEAIGWTLIHSLWQITLIALLVRFCLFLIPTRKAKIRYLILLLGMGAMVFWSAISFQVEFTKSSFLKSKIERYEATDNALVEESKSSKTRLNANHSKVEENLPIRKVALGEYLEY